MRNRAYGAALALALAVPVALARRARHATGSASASEPQPGRRRWPGAVPVSVLGWDTTVTSSYKFNAHLARNTAQEARRALVRMESG
jgi:hypothetical protein